MLPPKMDPLPKGKTVAVAKAEDAMVKLQSGVTLTTAGGKVNDNDAKPEPAPLAKPAPATGDNKLSAGERLDRIEAALRLGDPHAMAQAIGPA